MIEANIKRLAKKKGKTLTDVHNETGISRNTLSTISNGKSKGIQFKTLKFIIFL